MVGTVQPSLLSDVIILFTISLAADKLPPYQFNNQKFNPDSTTDL